MSEITDTGVRGYLKWLRKTQPAIYMKVAPVLAAKLPEAFSDREQSHAMGALMGLGDDAEAGASGASTDVADNANTGAASSSITGIIGNLVNAAATGYYTYEKLSTLKQLNDMQLQRVAAGLRPLEIDPETFGVPTVNVGVAPGTIKAGSALVIGLGLLVGAFLLLGGKHHRSV